MRIAGGWYLCGVDELELQVRSVVMLIAHISYVGRRIPEAYHCILLQDTRIPVALLSTSTVVSYRGKSRGVRKPNVRPIQASHPQTGLLWCFHSTAGVRALVETLQLVSVGGIKPVASMEGRH